MAYYSTNSVNYYITHTVKHSVNLLDPLTLDCVIHYTEQKPHNSGSLYTGVTQ